MTLVLENGDCLQLMRDLSDNSIDLIICDLPYGCLASPQGAIATGHEKLTPQAAGCYWDVKIDLPAFWKEVKRIRRNDNTPTIHFCTTKFGIDLINSNPNEFRYDLVWNKQRGVSFLSANKMPMRSHEMIYVFSKTGAYYNRVDIKGDFKRWKRERMKPSTQYGGAKRNDTEGGDGKRCVLSVIQNPTSSVRDGHPTEKPKELYKWLIERYCPAGGTVLDPTFGSGNSVFTAFDMGLNAIGFEKDKTFYDKAIAKINSDETVIAVELP